MSERSLSEITDVLTSPHSPRPVIAIVGAGPCLGLAIAMTFGARGFKAALLSRSPFKLEPTVLKLAKRGIEAAAFHVDVLDRLSIASGIEAAKQRFGQIDVLEFSPVDQVLPTPATESISDNLQSRINFNLHGAVAVVKQVLPDMVARASGTILFTTGSSSVHPYLGWDLFADFAQALHAAVAPNGVQVGYVAIGSFMERQPDTTPEAIAPLYWELHTQRDQVEKVFMPGTNNVDSKPRAGTAW